MSMAPQSNLGSVQGQQVNQTGQPSQSGTVNPGATASLGARLGAPGTVPPTQNSGANSGTQTTLAGKSATATAGLQTNSAGGGQVPPPTNTGGVSNDGGAEKTSSSSPPRGLSAIPTTPQAALRNRLEKDNAAALDNWGGHAAPHHWDYHTPHPVAPDAKSGPPLVLCRGASATPRPHKARW